MSNEEIKVSVVIPVYNAEDRIRVTLDCVKAQTLREFEAILVNDGSTDGSQNILEEYCSEDDRFHCIYQENKGVAAARNTGLDHCHGEYVTFYDADDVVPADSMEAMYERAKAADADLVVGSRKNIYLTKKKVNKQAMRFASNEIIDKYDEEFMYSFSVWNKFFRKSIIDEHNVRFENYNIFEDGIFVFSFLRFCQIIVGCDSVVYEYRKRPFFENKSLSQIRTLDALKAQNRAITRLNEIHDAMMDEGGIPLTDARRKLFDDACNFRIANANYLDSYYRRLWEVDDEAVQLSMQMIDDCLANMSPEKAEELKTRHLDLQMDKPLPGKREIIEQPSIAILITKDVDDEEMNTILGSLYEQLYPSFVVFIPRDKYNKIDKHFQDVPNMFTYDGSFKKKLESIIHNESAEFLFLLDEVMYFDEMTLRRLVNFLRRYPELDMSMVVPYSLNIPKAKCKRIKCLEGMFTNEIDDLDIHLAKDKELDCFHVNKLIRINALKDKGKRKAFLKIDWTQLGNNVSVYRLRGAWVYVKATEKEVINRSKKKWIWK